MREVHFRVFSSDARRHGEVSGARITSPTLERGLVVGSLPSLSGSRPDPVERFGSAAARGPAGHAEPASCETNGRTIPVPIDVCLRR